MAKTLNETLATARKNLPTADDNRELLVQTLEHLKATKEGIIPDVKQAIASGEINANSFYEITLDDMGSPDTTEDEAKLSKMRPGDIVKIDATEYNNLNQEVYLAIVYSWQSDYIVFDLFYNQSNSIACGGVLQYVYDEEWEVDDAYIENAGTKLYKHVIRANSTVDTTHSQNDIRTITIVTNSAVEIDAKGTSFLQVLQNALSFANLYDGFDYYIDSSTTSTLSGLFIRISYQGSNKLSVSYFNGSSNLSTGLFDTDNYTDTVTPL